MKMWVIELVYLNGEGLYCGPLRLLAWEVAQRLNKAKVPCNLITGQERDEIEGAKHTSLTVEMANVSGEYQCAVIDEIQVFFVLLCIVSNNL
jgi:ATP-dependent RNA helicase SUPV3L1/SUV3